MSILDTIKELFSGLLGDHAQNIQDTVQSIGDNEVAQNIKDKVADSGTQIQDSLGSVGDSANNAVEEIKNKLGK